MEAYRRLPECCEQLADPDLGLDGPSIVTLRLCTSFVKVGVHDFGIPLGQLAARMIREYGDSGSLELSWLERKVKVCAEAAGVPCHVEKDRRGDEILEPDGDIESLEVDHFIIGFEEAIRHEFEEVLGLGRTCGQEAAEPVRF